MTRLFALAIVSGALAVATLTVGPRDARADVGWCADVGVNICFPTPEECQRVAPTRTCVRGAG
jgi:hypothetical protein